MTQQAGAAARTSETVNWGSLAAMGAGAMAIVEVLSPAEGAAGSALFLAFLVLLLGGLAGFHTFQRDAYGRGGTIGFWVTVAGLTAQAIAAAGNVLGTEALQPLDDVGSLAVLIGFVTYGVSTYRAGRLPRWCGVAIPGAFIGWILLAMTLGDTGALVGGALLGVTWIALGYTLRSTAVAARHNHGAQASTSGH